ncbi:hypothetical protein BWK59_05550 [Flavobacterium davisii]|uniref:CdiI immunity protein domain-containing protein n=2 Tax=Flavobacterium davisii TaxID=2906077 RepID=A0A246GJD6_9FLAO|nr:hypothetical protein BWK59_05550 [Flavobacterium davisii]
MNPNSKFEFIFYLKFYRELGILEEMLKVIKLNDNSHYEFLSSIQSFIRIWRDKVEFGQYDDNFFHEIEQFKDYVDEGEIIFGSIPTQDFLEIVKEWRDFLIKCENDKEK